MYQLNQKVTARVRITEGGDGFPGDPNATFPNGDFIIAEPGEAGVVVEAGYEPTVRFDRTGTATRCFPYELN